MAGGLLLLVGATLFLALGVVVLVVLALTSRPEHTLPAEVAAARRHALATSVVAQASFVLSLVLLIAYATRPADGPVRPTPAWLGALPLIAACASLVVLAVGELTWPRPRGSRREANLNPRGMHDLLPLGWTRALVLVSAVTSTVIAAGWALSAPDGHSISHASPSGQWSRAAGPFPGPDYGLPQLVALSVALLLGAGVLRLAVLRAAVVRSDVGTDNLLRRASAARALRVVVAAAALTAGADLFFGGSAARRVYDGLAQDLAVGAMVVGLALGAAAIGLLLAPPPRLRREAPVDRPATRVSTEA